MTIGYVLHPYEESHASGMGYSMLEVCKQLAASHGPHQFCIYATRPVDRKVVPGSYESIVMPKGILRQFFYFMFQCRADVLLFTAPLLPLWLPSRIKAMVLCKELGSQKLRPGRLADRAIAFVRDHVLMPRTLEHAAAIAASSEATKADILRYYRVAPEKVTVIPEGYQDWKLYAGVPEHTWEDAKPFFFFTGKVKPRKNVHGIVTAFIEYKEKTKSDAHLMIAGDYGGDYHRSMVEMLEACGLGKYVHFLGYVSAEEMHWLYANARVFVFPSLNEGFGMPLVEAMSFGVPTITSLNSPMADIADGGSL